MGYFMPRLEFPIALISGGVGYLELLLLFTLILVLFGPARLPGIARKIGYLVEQLRKAAHVFQQNLLSMDDDLRAGPMEDELEDPPKQQKDENQNGPSH